MQKINSNVMDAHYKRKLTQKEEFIIVTHAHLQFALIALLKLTLFGRRKIFHLMKKIMKKIHEFLS